MRVVIFGRSGSGKSTFAHELGKRTGLPVHHIDKIFFTHNWVTRDSEEFLALQKKILTGEEWIIDGNSLRTINLRFDRATHIVFFDYPRWRCFARIYKRLFDKNTAIDDRAEGCPEKVSFALLRYTWNFSKEFEKKVAKHLKKHSKTPYFTVKKNQEKDKTFNALYNEYKSSS